MMSLEHSTSYLLPFANWFTNRILESRFLLRTGVIVVAFLIIWLTGYLLTRRTSLCRQVVGSCNSQVLHELHKATFENDVISSIRLIQKYPELINVPHSVDGYTPFMRACLNGNTQLVNFMLSCGASITLKSWKGETPFYLAVFYLIQNPQCQDATCIRSLYYAGSNINATNGKGYTALHLAAMFGHTRLVRWLLGKGASKFVQPCPYEIARMQGHFETAVVLRGRRLPALEQS